MSNTRRTALHRVATSGHGITIEGDLWPAECRTAQSNRPVKWVGCPRPSCPRPAHFRWSDHRVNTSEGFSLTRVYNPRTGTWLSQDPMGYVDGLNRYQMEQLSPLTSTDPHGCATATTSTAPATQPALGYQLTAFETGYSLGNNGAYDWHTQWKLSKPSAKGGLIIQKVQVVADIFHKNGDRETFFADRMNGIARPITETYYEASEVVPRQIILTRRSIRGRTNTARQNRTIAGGIPI